MQATIVMLIALGGLGCQNPAGDGPPQQPAAGQAAPRSTGAATAPPAALPDQPPAPPSPSPVAPAPTAEPDATLPAPPTAEPVATDGAVPFGYSSPYRIGAYPMVEPPDDDSFGACLRDTICSFFIGRSPGVPSAREIEAAYCAGHYHR